MISPPSHQSNNIRGLCVIPLPALFLPGRSPFHSSHHTPSRSACHCVAVWRAAVCVAAPHASRTVLSNHPLVILHSQLSPTFICREDRWTAYLHLHLPRAKLTKKVISNTVEELKLTGLTILRCTLSSATATGFSTGSTHNIHLKLCASLFESWNMIV